ncbi:MAG: DUF2284 domain-containing protein [Eubacteriaceae bacterium]|nr:DUF2284 domain-containing protein [Eubacteriaceae bacterium]
MGNTDVLAAMAREAGFDEIVNVPSTEIVISEVVLGQCARNTCGNYGKNYSCPPLSGTLEECINRMTEYEYALVIDFRTSMKSRFEIQEGGAQFREAVEKLRIAVQDSGIEGKVFAAGTCRICEVCGAITGEECRYPDLRRYSLEGSGVDVVRTSMNLKMKYNAGPGTMTYFAMVGYNG